MKYYAATKEAPKYHYNKLIIIIILIILIITDTIGNTNDGKETPKHSSLGYILFYIVHTLNK